MKILLSTVFAFFFVSTLCAASPQPVDVKGKDFVGQRHSGYGEYSELDDYEGVGLLKKQCVGAPPREEDCPKSGVLQELGTAIADDYTATLFRNYASRILNSELKLACGQELPANFCSPKLVQENSSDSTFLESAILSAHDLPKHEEIRNNAMNLQNALSAALLVKRCDVSGDTPVVKSYRERLKLHFPFLFKPQSNGYESLLRIFENEQINIPSESLYSRNADYHSNTLQTLMATLAENPDLMGKAKSELQRMLNNYAESLKVDLLPGQKLCSMDLKDLIVRYPQVINQALIDLPNDKRELVSSSLCKIKDFYNPQSYDTDCDGLVDAKDSAPSNPFSPNTEVHVSKMMQENPPWGTFLNYKIKKEKSHIQVTLDLNLNFDSSLNPSEQKDFSFAFASCLKQDLASELKTVFETLKQSKSQFFSATDQFDVHFNITKSSRSAYGLSVHRCWCSTCSLFYTFKGMTKQVPQSFCLADIQEGKVPAGEKISQAEMQAIKLAYDRENQASGNAWWDQEDSNNLTLATPCDVLKHETMHRLGLADEYPAEYYPFNRVGVQNNIMYNNSQILPRHLAKILSANGSDNFCSL